MGCNKKNVQLGVASSQMQAWTSGWPVTWKSEKIWKSQGEKWVREKSGNFIIFFQKSGKITFLSNVTRDSNLFLVTRSF